MNKIKDRLFLGFVKLVFAWTILAISFDVFMLVTQYTNPQLATKIGNELTWKLDGRFKK